MGICNGCAILFRNLTEDHCLKCRKLSKATSAVEREAIENQPQCEACSVIFPYMKNVLCGACREQTASSGIVSTTSASTDEILSRAAIFQASANQHRLNQPITKNKGLEAADAARIKAKISSLQKQAKADVVTVDATLFYYPKNGTAAKKAQLLPDYKKYFGTDSAKSLLEGTRNTLEKTWSATPAANVSGLKLNFQDAEFGIVTLKSAVVNFKPTKEYIVGTIDAMYSGLRSESKISDADFKARKLSLRVYAHEVPSESIVDNDDLYYLSAQSSFRRSGTRSVARSQTLTKRKASESISTNREYTSAFRPRKLIAMPQIEFDKYNCDKTTFIIDADGNLDKVVSRNEEIEIAKNWRQFAVTDKVEGGYLSKGATKYAFMGRIGSRMYAIFQCGVTSQVDEASNHADLIAELKLLVLGQYFADSFATRAKMYGVRIPNIRWNSEGAFVGKATNCWLDEDSSLMFESFLAAPLLDTSALYTERKFSGSIIAGCSVDVVGVTIDAYAHHIFIDTDGEMILTDLQGIVGPDQSVILFDPQAHSRTKDSGFWDQGFEGIEAWKEAHKCNEMCKKLRLKGKEVSQGPLRHGFTPPRDD
ncbi:hypothetical protein C0993_006361 [Termitomyces sp. T159_Od127]|nr:hypothetical protein C0993_006361 [Termitomyces sp. T159_Od127]